MRSIAYCMVQSTLERCSGPICYISNMIQLNHNFFLDIYIKKNNFNVTNETYLTY